MLSLCAATHECELSLINVSEALCFSPSCVFKYPLPQTVWGAEMVDGVGWGGEAADMAAGQNQLAV